MNLYLGIDIGSVSVNTIIINEKKEIVEEHYIRTKGQPFKVALQVLKDIFTRISKDKIKSVAVTGSGGKIAGKLLGAKFVNELIAQAKSVSYFYPDARTIIEIGGEDSKLILLKYDEKLKTNVIEDFAMNTMCAAGTGSFLDQQASRLGFTIEEFSEYALKSKKPPRIAGRCSVFAKTDMIHLQQKATPDYDIVAGLCYALARNFKSDIGRGKKFIKPILFQGGVAANKGIRRAFEDILNLEKNELIIPKYYASMGAIGAVLALMESKDKTTFKGLDEMEEYTKKSKHETSSLEPLPQIKALNNEEEKKIFNLEKTDAYLGIDVGSTSTKAVLLDKNKNMIVKCYLMTAGRPIEAVRKVLAEIYRQVGDNVNILGVGTTGSGRYLTGDFVGADIVRNEITAQATASIDINDKVDTIFEIGGQDSKYISIDAGAIVDFEMNKVCAAGTGSFLEEQSERLDLSIKEEFGNMALCSKNPACLGERCTVFMESDLNHHQQRGAKKENLVAGLSYSIVHNYLNKVVAGKKVGDNIFFQGAVAYNRGVVAAFEKVTGKKITVPMHTEVTGSIGAAILAMEMKKQKSSFKGFKEISQGEYSLESFECKGCPNRCEINKVIVENEKPLYYGSRCEKYEIDKKKTTNNIPDLFEERRKLLLNIYKEKEVKGKKMGIPMILFFHELYPMWKAFFSELGFEVVPSDETNRTIINKGIENISAETCFPIKVSHGHILNLIEKNVDYIFLPAIVNLKQTSDIKYNYACPYIQSIPYLIKSAIDLKDTRMISPLIHLQRGRKNIERALNKLGKELGKNQKEIKNAISVAESTQENFYKALEEKGKDVLNNLKEDEKAVVIVSRPYNGCDKGINLDIPKKLRDINILAIPMDFLPIDREDVAEDWPNMYWKYGQRIMSASKIIKKDKRLYPVYITNFGCGPDSFITRFFKEELNNKPYLLVEVDEHSADVGVITRCEAFLDSLKNIKEKVFLDKKAKPSFDLRNLDKKRTVWIPYMGENSYVLKSLLTKKGYKADIFPESDDETIKLGRKYTSGKECYPCIITTGDMLRVVKQKDFNRDKNAFFIGTASGPCRFGQYCMLQRLILDELGYNDVPIVTLNSTNSYSGMGVNFVRHGLKGMAAMDILGKLSRKTRPYEVNKGETDKVYMECVHNVANTLIEGDLPDVIRESLEKFKQVKVNTIKKPLIGMIGEIYVRNNWFSNDNVIKQIEALGGEVWLAPITEWFSYVAHSCKIHSFAERDIPGYLKYLIQYNVMKHDEHKLFSIVKDFLKEYEEPSTEKVFEYCKPYMHPLIGTEAVLSMGKSVDFVKKNVAGIINAIPFNCLPGTIVTALSKRFREYNSNIPFLTLPYDGLKQANAETRLEAFMYQTKQFMGMKQ